MGLPDKRRVRAAFSRAAATYDAAAVLQRAVCERLLATLDDALPARILDAGCGTGYGARLLERRWPDAGLTVADFAADMARSAAAGQRSVAIADIEALPFASGAFDLWWSSLTVQWCDPVRVLSEARRVLAAGGRVALSTLGPATYAELRDAFAGIDRHRHTLDFVDADALAEAATAAGLRELRLRRETVVLHYPDLRQLLGAVKAIGANALGDGRRGGMMGKTAWQALNAAYETCRRAEGLPASYDVILLSARK